MSKIRILSEVLSNKIAAGEVVERPASVVKELVENSLDAGSARILVEIENGGKSLIRVSDDGEGMGHDDALLAIERFATSKISEDPDLYRISTLGFRGEALPSIAAVSDFSLTTRDAHSQTGLEITVKGGKLLRVTETGAPKGTMVSVRHLFLNTPARRKFLKTVSTEMAHIADTVSCVALAYPGVQFRLLHNGRDVKQLPETADPLARIGDVLGRSLLPDLFPLGGSRDAISISGAVSSPRISRATSKGLYLFVNGRMVRDRLLMHAIFEGYSQRLVKGQFPVAVLFVEMPPDQVDVNVHPTKHEVRFLDQVTIHKLVAQAVSETLDAMIRPSPKTAQRPAPVSSESVFESTIPFAEPRESPAGIPRHPVQTPVETPPVSTPVQQPIWESKGFSDLKIIGQLHNTYILCESREGLILIDQHAAHERIVFERLKRRKSGHRSPAQALLTPESLELNFTQAGILESLLPVFGEIGLEIEPFGHNTFLIKTVPASLTGSEIVPVIREILDHCETCGLRSNMEAIMEKSLTLMACHGAIRANQELSRDQIGHLLKQLDQCETPSSCPHGRPTWIRWSIQFLEKSFQRIL
jgi:DNA mismatch repair protein MutL